MTFAASIALASAGIACCLAVMGRLFSRAPGWREQRYFSLAALAAASYAALNIPTTSTLLSDEAVLLSTRLQVAFCALHAYAWLRYSTVTVGERESGLDRVLLGILAVLAFVALLPGTHWLTGELRDDAFEPLGLWYRSPTTTPLADAAYAVLLAVVLVPIARFARAWRRGVSNAGVQLAALACLLLMGVNDALVLGHAYAAPYLLDLAFLLPLAAVGYALTARFVEDARAHAALRQDLERQVAERTADLGRAQEALSRAEKLAALGQFAAGVAHEVNNPASVVSANLAYLQERERDALSEEGRGAVRECIESVQRIAVIVRQLLDAGRVAASPEARTRVALRPLVESASAVARARFGKRVRVTNLVPDGAHTSGHEGILVQVLMNLVANAVQAVPDHRTDGHVVVRADEEGGRVRVHVDDNGTGMEPEILRRVFEPFFTTKPFGSGTGLGLAVSRGLVMSLGGELRLESTAGAGTRATIELAAAPAPEPRAPAPAPEAGRPRHRVLVVDDEVAVLRSLRRLLEPRYGVELASGVDDALARIHADAFDLVLCDVMMPGGGGERLYGSLVRRAPAAARRVVFFTGGAVTDSARRFLHGQPQPILYKPLDVEQLARVAERMCGEAGAGEKLTH